MKKELSKNSDNVIRLTNPLPDQIDNIDFKVLVINASHEMAKEITSQLAINIPGCSIIYAPTIEIAKWILKRRNIDLLVSSTILPDGNISKLEPTLDSITNPPNLVVVGKLKQQNIINNSNYKISNLKKIEEEKKNKTQIKLLGEDIRNDLNNPLQEIVAMVFVAKASEKSNMDIDEALNAIEKAAKNMSKVVNTLEDKIDTVVNK